ncbi:Predicted nuclease of the RNAse H fold, HicB family [Pseudomonas japonica]|uniref:Predicted nuclease of the RNAse H fold, HicB family n=1 Tax=Pseudomonas japonica TaxID=256466 RepID=A0A239CF17_9PSED|nr:Predicted nuclease of the RNAse H fold, HicB family [Pseudomonas japonica]
MLYPISIEWEEGLTAIGIQIPDIPGAVTAADTFEEACAAAVEVAHIMLDEIAGSGRPIPLPSSAVAHRGHPEFEGMDWGALDVDVTAYLAER